MTNYKYSRKVKVPVRIEKTGKGNYGLVKTLGYLSLVLVLLIGRVPHFQAYEAHIVNVTAKICRASETRTIGFWKNHSEIYLHYLPQTVGDEQIDSFIAADGVFSAGEGPIMKWKLRSQLLAMKFNIAHFGIGEYFVEEKNKTLKEVIIDADNLLKMNPEPSKEALEEMKDLLDYLNNLHQLRICFNPKVKVVTPNGGEEWWVGRSYDILWESKDIDCSSESIADIWYSGDSGKSFANVVLGTENDGLYNWRIPLFIDDYFLPSSKARIKVVIKCSDDLEVQGQDMSDSDFCPPIDYSLLTEEELLILSDIGLYTVDKSEAGVVVPEVPQEEPLLEENATSSDEISTSSEPLVLEEKAASTSSALENSTSSDDLNTSSQDVIFKESTSSSSEVSSSSEPVLEDIIASTSKDIVGSSSAATTREDSSEANPEVSAGPEGEAVINGEEVFLKEKLPKDKDSKKEKDKE